MMAQQAGMMLARLFKLDRSEVPKLMVFALFGLMLEIGLGIGVSAGDAAFLTNVGADQLPLVFLLTPLVMIVYTIIFAGLGARYSVDRLVDITLGLLVIGGVGFWLLLGADLDAQTSSGVYLGLKLYLAMWQIALYSLFWNFADAYFDIQDAKRLFPMFAAGAAAGTAVGALFVGLLAPVIPLRSFFLIWAVLAVLTAPVAIILRRRWSRLTEAESIVDQISGKRTGLVTSVRRSPYTLLLAMALFVTVLMTNLGEYQYSAVLSEGRSESELAALLGRLYAGANIFTMLFSLFLFNRLVSRLGVRNVALLAPIAYFMVFSYFFVNVGATAAILVFMANHAIQVAVENNNQNLLFNALPTGMKGRLRTIIEGICEPLATCLMGAFLLFIAARLNLRELAAVGIVLGLGGLAIILFLRNRYPDAMAANMQHGWLDFSKVAPNASPPLSAAYEEARARADAERAAGSLADPSPLVRKDAVQRLQALVRPGDDWLVPQLVHSLPILDREEQVAVIGLLGLLGDVEALPEMLDATDLLGPRERRAMGVMITGLGGAAVPALALVLRQASKPYRVRGVASRSLTGISFAQFSALVPVLVAAELEVAQRAHGSALVVASAARRSSSAKMLARLYREQVAGSVDYMLELLALARMLPDYDLLVTNLHSSNRKARANALETIETGVGHGLFRALEPLLKVDPAAVRGDRHDASRENLRRLLDAALRSDVPIEAAAAAEALKDILPAEELAAALRLGIRKDMAPLLADTILLLLGAKQDGQTVVQKVAELRATPAFRYATTEALAALAATGRGEADVNRISGRFVDLALSRLKAQDDLDDAA